VTQADTDGEYDIVMGGKNISIYCHKMGSSLPREYLSLPSGETENYSEIYGQRLVAPNSCPSNGTINRSES
jgi:GON domain